MANAQPSGDDIAITGYGGVNEIGGNKFFVETESSSLVLDFGMSFGAEGQFFEEYLQPRSNTKLHDLLALELLPAIGGIYRQDALAPEGLDDIIDVETARLWDTGLQSYEEAEEVGEWTPDGVFISHAHLDHIGYLPYLGDIPVMWSETTETLASAIGEISPFGGFDAEYTEYEPRYLRRTQGGYFPGEVTLDKEDPISRTTELTAQGMRIPVGNDIELEAFDVGHSIPGAQAALIETHDKQIVYTGDLRFHGRSENDIGRELQGLRPDIMLCEGTRIKADEPDDEAQVEQELIDYAQSADGLVIVAFAWKDLERYETLREVADAVDRQLVVDPRLAYLKARLGESIYAEGVRAFVERSDSMTYSPADYTRSKHKAGEIPIDDWDSDEGVTDTTHLHNGVKVPEINDSPSHFILQLDYYRFKNLVDLELPDGSIFIRAQTEPFNEEMELSEERLINWLRHFGLNSENDHEPYQTHASGHAAGVDIQRMINQIEPKTLIPIHTEYPRAFDNPAGDNIELAEGEPWLQ